MNSPHALLLSTCLILAPIQAIAAAEKPNVLFIAVDDLNDWIGCLGGHPQTKTPNLDRLAASGVLFTNAYCPAPSCNPSRSAIFSGRPPHRSGLYQNMQKLREVMPDEELIPRHFSRHDLCGLPGKPGISPNSLVPLLRDPAAPWPHAAITHLDNPENLAISTRRWRYIHYKGGEEELYDIETDPHERDNLAGDPAHATRLAEMRAMKPSDIAPIHEAQPGINSFAAALEMDIEKQGAAPVSRNSSEPVAVLFQNHRQTPVSLFWLDEKGTRHEKGEVPGASRRMFDTFAGHTWLLVAKDDSELGHIVAPAKPARVFVR